MLNKNIVKKDNMLVGILGLTFRAFAVYCNEFDPSIFTLGQVRAYKQQMGKSNDKSQILSGLLVKKQYYKMKVYMKGILKRIGELNRGKDHVLISEKTAETFNEELTNFFIVNNNEKDKFYISGNDGDFLSYLRTCINISRKLLKNSDLSKNDIKYIKTYITKLDNFLNNEFDEHLKESQEHLIKIRDMQIKIYKNRKSEKIKEFKKIKVNGEVEKLPTTKNSAIKKIKSIIFKISDITEERFKFLYKDYKLTELIQEYQNLKLEYETKTKLVKDIIMLLIQPYNVDYEERFNIVDDYGDLKLKQLENDYMKYNLVNLKEELKWCSEYYKIGMVG